jgi:hypothetical protein
MFDQSVAEPPARHNLFSWASLVLAFISGYIYFGNATRESITPAVLVVAGLAGVIGLTLAIIGVWKAKTRGRGRGVGIVGMVVNSMFSVLLLVGLGPGGAGKPRVVLALTIAVAGLFYVLTLQRTLKECSPASRAMAPGRVWLLLIPIFDFVWHFLVVSKLAASVGNELKNRNALEEEPKTGKTLGIATSVVLLVALLVTAVSAISARSASSDVNVVGGGKVMGWALGGFLWLAGGICWLVYWVDVAWFAKLLRPPAEPGAAE